MLGMGVILIHIPTVSAAEVDEDVGNIVVIGTSIRNTPQDN